MKIKFCVVLVCLLMSRAQARIVPMTDSNIYTDVAIDTGNKETYDFYEIIANPATDKPDAPIAVPVLTTAVANL